MDWMPVILFLVGLLLIILGSGWFIDSTIWIAKVLKIPNIIIGATIVSICTTLPETMVSGSSAFHGNADIAFGNALGSIAFNTGFILALTILLIKPQFDERTKLIKTSAILIFVLSLLTAFAFIFNAITRVTGFLFLAILSLYLYSNVRDAKKDQAKSKKQKYAHVNRDKKTVIKNIFLFVFGITFTIAGANLLVTNGEAIARMLGVPDIIIGLTLTSFGTSLPELVTSISAIIKKAHDISIGNVLGANILNILLVIGLSSTILPINIQPSYLSMHIPFVFSIVALVVFFVFSNKKHFMRWNGIVIMGVYSAYLYFMIT